MTKGVFMKEKDINRAKNFSNIAQKRISQSTAAKQLHLSLRQTQRLYAEYKNKGDASLISKKRGKISNNAFPVKFNEQIKNIIGIDLYVGFRPTFMCEKLAERHGIVISRETTRKLMTDNGTWIPNKKRCPVIHQQRPRRARWGELKQVDGSPHAWFEERGEPCALINFVDDATGQTFGQFSESETTKAYMITLKKYIIKFGIPLALYSDRHGIFRVNKPGCIKHESLTQFGRACKELGIQIICANSPQAKGRVEKNNGTQQDRLIKEMRLAGICTIPEGNQFLEDIYWEKYNSKFAVKAACDENAHREAPPNLNLDKILCRKETRTVSKNLEIQYKNKIYQIILQKPSAYLRRAKIMVIEQLDGRIFLEYKGKDMPFKLYAEQQFQGKVVSSKEIDKFLREKIPYKVAYDHRWNQQGRAERKQKELMRGG